MLEPGARFGAYRLIALLGRGGMGEVWRALKVGPSGLGWSRQVALKVILPQFAREGRFRDLFISEAQIAAGLTHPNIVAVTDFGMEQEMLWLEQELVDGPHMSRVLEHSAGGLPLPIATYITCEMLKGLGFAHAHEHTDGRVLRVIHRDIKPGNLMTSREGFVKVTDFGIAKLVHDDPSLTDVKGTVGYLAPELLEGAQPTETTDLFAAGLVFWELLTGRKLFWGETEAARLFKTFECAVPHLSDWGVTVPRELEEVLRWMLMRDPRQRPPTAQDALNHLQRVAAGHVASAPELKRYLNFIGIRPASVTIPPLLNEKTRAPTGSLAGEVTRTPHRHRWGGFVLGAGLAAAVAAGVTIYLRPQPPAAAPAPAPAPTTIPMPMPLPQVRAQLPAAPPAAPAPVPAPAPMPVVEAVAAVPSSAPLAVPDAGVAAAPQPPPPAPREVAKAPPPAPRPVRAAAPPPRKPNKPKATSGRDQLLAPE